MLRRLSIRNVVLIAEADVEFAPGLSVFTGETGAGKSIILDALGLALGARADARLIRSGAETAQVTAEFDLPSVCAQDCAALLHESGLEADPGAPLLLRRSLGRDGKSRAFVNDQSVSVQWLRTLGERLVEIHGQFAGHGLLDPAQHLSLLDAAGGLESGCGQVSAAWQEWRAAVDALEQLKADNERTLGEESWLRAALTEIQQVSPQAGEADALAERRKRLHGRERTLEALHQAATALGGPERASASLAQAARHLARLPPESVPELADMLARLDQALDQVAEAERSLHRAAEELAGDGGLEELEDRLFALKALARKHQVTEDALPELQRRITEKLSALEQQALRVQQLQSACDAAQARYISMAKTLRAGRARAAEKLAADVQRELPALKLEAARFAVELTPLPPEKAGPRGMDQALFLVAANPGAPAGPLHKVASGGEMARLSLAMKLALHGRVPVLIFDEVDAGIGGATAAAVGERLRRLAAGAQVLVVTHSPQVAAQGEQHFHIAKHTKGAHTTTRVEILSAAARQQEIARMLAGQDITPAAQDAAAALLAAAGTPAPRKAKVRKAGAA